MKLLLVSDDGQIIDSTEIDREDWDNLSPLGALTLLHELNPDAS